MANIREAIKGFLASMREDGTPSPISKEYEIVEGTAQGWARACRS